MSIQSRRELENTQKKLAELEVFHHQTQRRPMPSEHVRELTLRSVKKRINQLKEEIARFEAHAADSGASDRLRS